MSASNTVDGTPATGQPEQAAPSAAHVLPATGQPEQAAPSSTSAALPPRDTGAFSMEAVNTEEEKAQDNVIVKVGMVGDSGIGKTSLMVRYVEKRWDSEYVETLGINFMEKRIQLPHTSITVSIWDLGGDRTFASMLPMCVVDAAAVMFLFDLTSLPSLHSVKEWYRQVRGLNKAALPLLVGTKFDLYLTLSQEEQAGTLDTARKYSKAMKAPLVFCSASHGVNVQKLFKLAFERIFGLDASMPRASAAGEPIFEY